MSKIDPAPRFPNHRKPTRTWTTACTKAVSAMPAMSAKPFFTPPACLVTSPTMMPPQACVKMGTHVMRVHPWSAEGSASEDTMAAASWSVKWCT